MLKPFITLALSLFAGVAHASPPDCEVEPQLKLDRITAKVILVGETHGTDQAPAFVARLVCGLLAQGRPVTLALERTAQEQPALDRYLTSSGRDEDARALLGAHDWASTHQDGRSSAAMFRLVEQLRRWRQAGQPVDVLAMTPFQDLDSQGAFDRALAGSVTAALAAHPERTVVVFAGSYHTVVASKEHQAMFGTPSIGDLLAERGPVHVVGLTSSPGTAWNCTQDCGSHATLGGPWTFEDSRVDTAVALGPTTASGPAAQPRVKAAR